MNKIRSSRPVLTVKVKRVCCLMANCRVEKAKSDSNFYGVDIAKVILAVLVVVLHTQAFADFGKPIHYGVHVLTRVAVPFYFIASGYFLFRGISIDDSGAARVVKYLRKIAKLYIVWTVIYSPVILKAAVSHSDSAWGVMLRSAKMICVTGYYHLWYLLALIVSVVVIYFFRKLTQNLLILMVFSSTMYIIGLMLSEFYVLADSLASKSYITKVAFQGYFELFDSARNGLFDALFFVTIGVLIAYRPVKIRLWFSVVALIVALVCLEFEGWLVERLQTTQDGSVLANDLFISIVPASFFLFIISLSVRLKESFNSVSLRIFSTFLYLVHPLAVIILKTIAWVVTKANHGLVFEVSNLVYFVFALLVSSLLFKIVRLLEARCDLTWLRNLYM